MTKSKLVKKGKVSIAVSLLISTLVWSVGLTAFSLNVMAASAGDLIKQDGSASVYYLGSDMKRYVFSNQSIFASWFSSSATVTTVSSSVLLGYELGGNVVARSGRLVQVVTNDTPWKIADSKVYALSNNGTLQAIDSAATAVALFGAGWESKIVPTPEVLFTNYKVGTALSSSSMIPDGFLVKTASSSDVFVIDGGQKRAVSAEGFTANWYKNSDVVTASSLSAYGDGSAVSGKESSLTAVNGGSSTTTPPVVVGGGLTVALASDTPISQNVVDSTDRFLMLKANVSANGGAATITGLKLKRTGLGSSADFNRVWLEVDGVRHGSSKSINTSDDASLLFSSDAQQVAIADGQTKAFEIWASFAAPTAGVQDALTIDSFTTTSAVNGLPVTGKIMTVASASAPDINYDDQSIGTTVDIGDKNVEIAKIKLTNQESNEPIVVRGITFKSAAPSSGTRIDTSDLTNFRLYNENGDVLVAGPISMSADNYLHFKLTTPYEIAKGTSEKVIFVVKADVAGGPGNKVTLDVEYAGDIDAYGKTNGYGVDATSSTWATTTVTIGNAVLSVNVDSTINPAARTIIDDQNDVVLIKGNFRADQGAVTVTGMRVTLTGSDIDMGTTDEYENLKVYVDGVLISEATGTSIASTDSLTSINVDFTDEFGLDGITPFYITIDANDVGNNEWIYASVPGASMTATRDSDNASITPSGTATGNKVTLATATVQVTASSTSPSVTRVKGSDNVIFAAFDAQAGTSSDTILKSIKLALVGTGGTADQSDVNNIELLDSSMAVWQTEKDLDSSEQINFTGLNKSLKAGASMRFYVRGDINDTILSSAITALNLEIIEVTADDANGDSIDVTDDGSTVISSTNEVNDDGATTLITIVDRGTLSVELASATPKSKQVRANSTDVLATEAKLRAQYEDVNITKLVLTTVAGSANDDELDKVSLYADGKLVKAVDSIISGVATFNFTSGELKVLAGGTVTLQVKANISSTVDSVTDSGATIQFSINDFNADIEAEGTANDIYATVYASGGTGVTLTSNATAAINDATDISSSDTSIVYDTLAVGTIDAGNIILIGSEYMLVTANASNTLTVIRAVSGSTAAAHLDDAAITEYDMKMKGNTILTYANYPIVTLASSQPTGTLHTGEWEAYKFTVTPVAGAEEDLRLEEIVIRLDAEGITAAAGDGWYVTNAKLFNGSNQVGSTVTTDVTAAGDITFATLDSDDDGIITSATTFTVKVDIALGSSSGAIGEFDTLQLSINDFGSANAAGSITAGDFDWIDMEASTTVVEWVDTTSTTLQGSVYGK